MKKITLRLVLITIYCLCFIGKLECQIPEKPVAILSPNAASLGVFGDVPVSLFMGTPTISIPLHQIELDGFSMPVSLDYHASGVRPDQRSGVVGVNWTLNAGGVINRKVNGLPDEYDSSDGILREVGFYFNRNLLAPNNWNTYSFLEYVANNNSYHDYEPDEFSFSFPGHSGSFFLAHDGTWKARCNKPIKVELYGFNNIPFSNYGTYVSVYSKYIAGFRITTEDGTMFSFGGGVKTVDFSIDFFNQAYADWIATAWYLTSITLPNLGGTITFEYDNYAYKGEFINQLYTSYSENRGTTGESGGSLGFSCSSSGYDNTTKVQGQLISTCYLRAIITPREKVLFELSPSHELKYDDNLIPRDAYLPILDPDKKLGVPKCLEKLKWYKVHQVNVWNINNKLQKRYNLTYNDNINQYTQRLMLEQVEIVGSDLSGKGKYKFEYHNPHVLYPYLAGRIDHWGFYNNSETRYGIHYYSSREPGSLGTLGTLTKIIYPTGGYTRFVYGGHKYGKELSIDRSFLESTPYPQGKDAGGIRIRHIVNSVTGNREDEVTVKKYFYVNDYLTNRKELGASSGILGGKIQYEFDYWIKSRNSNNTYAIYRKNIFTTQSVLPACNNSGSHIGYSEVVEVNQDNSFTIYKFTNFDDGHMDERCQAILQASRTAYEPYTSKAHLRGHLKEQSDYDSNANLVRKKTFNYVLDNADPSTNNVRALKGHTRRLCANNGVTYIEGVSYKNNISSYLLSKEEVTLYDSGNEIKTTTSYTYNDKLLSTSRMTDSKGQEFVTNYVYSKDILKSPYVEMKNNHILNAMVHKYVVKNNGSSNDIVVSSDYVQYQRINNYYYKPYRLFSSKKLTDREITQYDMEDESSPVRSKYTLDAEFIYDSKNKLIQINYKDGSVVSYLWGYKRQFPVAEIKNATYQEVISNIDPYQLEIMPGGLDLSSDYVEFLNNLRTNLPNAYVTTYTYNVPVGMTTMTDPRGITTYYEYDASGRLRQTYIGETDSNGNEVKKVIEVYDYNYSSQ